jgi:hypothetical protein
MLRPASHLWQSGELRAVRSGGRWSSPCSANRRRPLGHAEDDAAERNGRLEIAPAPTPMRLADEGDGVAAIADVEMPVLTAAMVRQTLERTRRSRPSAPAW